MAHAHGFPITYKPLRETSAAIELVDVDCALEGKSEQPLTLKKMRAACAYKNYVHFVQVEFRTTKIRPTRYTFAATQVFALRLENLIHKMQIHEKNSKGGEWKGESLGRMIHLARKNKEMIKDSCLQGLMSKMAKEAKESFSAKYRASKAMKMARAESGHGKA
tara:strand:- start:2161 stop:2649 length:489 start_codon:yes stop_codon:yes gene_type:complete